MELIVRRALPEDGAAAAPLIVNAIGDIANHMTAQEDPQLILDKITDMVRGTKTRHSHRFTYIAEVQDALAGVLVLYHGSEAEALDRFLYDELRKKGHQRTIEPEAHLDEWYIDTVSVNVHFQGQGIGTALLRHAEKIISASGGGKLALNVDIDKRDALRLYQRLGFSISEPWTIIGEPFHHMVKTVPAKKPD